jgi:NNP family nitrate/nitrite transporter-like MFS transporter
VYAGTAGGVGSTLQLLGAVVIPSYILIPILGANYPALYGIAGVLCLVAAACVFMLPEVLKR